MTSPINATHETKGFFPLYYTTTQNANASKKEGFFSKILNTITIVTLNILGIPIYNSIDTKKTRTSLKINSESEQTQSFGLWPFYYKEKTTTTIFHREGYLTLASRKIENEKTKLFGFTLHTTIDVANKYFWIFGTKQSNTHISYWFF